MKERRGLGWTCTTVVLTLQSMGTRSLRTAISLLILSGCAAAVPELKPPPEGFAWSPEAPFRNQRKIEISSEAQAFSHFLKGYALLGEGDFDPALKEFEAAVAAAPNDGFLHFRLASPYLRQGEFKKALVEAETAGGLEARSAGRPPLLCARPSLHA